jgi:RNA polymerase subunit RPABC4/transcription elongation factor Spt4
MNSSVFDMDELRARLEFVGIVALFGAFLGDMGCGTLIFPGVEGEAGWAHALGNFCAVVPETPQTVLTYLLWIGGAVLLLANYFLGAAAKILKAPPSAVRAPANVVRAERPWEQKLLRVAQVQADSASKTDDKGGRDCAYCEAQIPEHTNSCPSCGRGSFPCSSCGKELADDAKFCPRCGTDQ